MAAIFPGLDVVNTPHFEYVSHFELTSANFSTRWVQKDYFFLQQSCSNLVTELELTSPNYIFLMVLSWTLWQDMTLEDLISRCIFTSLIFGMQISSCFREKALSLFVVYK